MRFEHPQFLWLLLLAVPLLGTFFVWVWRARRRALTAFVSGRLLGVLTANVSAERQKARLALAGVAVALLLVALARPQLGFSWDDAKSRGLDVVVAIDTSRSMLANDVVPNRLKRAQLAALDLKRMSRGDRFGVVAFAGNAFLQCPLTLDDEVYRQSIDALDVNIIPQGGTAVAEAIQAADGAFKKDNDNHKVLIIFTDGEDHDGHALDAARAAGKEGVRIFTVGIGTPEGELLRVTDTQGRTEFLKDSEGHAVKSRLNEELLRQIAQAAGGFYLRMSGANTMNVLYERGLAPLPKGEISSQRVKRYHERYQWVLGAVIVLLLVEMFLPERKPSKSPDRVELVRGAVKSASLVLLLALGGVPTNASASAREGLKEYEKGRFEQSMDEYERALRKKPDDPRLHYNVGAAAFQNKNYEQAAEHLNSALAAPDLGLQQRAYYNLGNAQYRLGEEASAPEKRSQTWEQAVKSFDSALTLNTNDVDARFNLEFVRKKLEELKQQQQQNQKQDGQQNKDDQNKDQQKQQQQKQDQQKQDSQKPKDGEQEKKDKQDSQQQKQQEQQSQQQQQEQKQQGSKPDQKQEDQQKSQQASKPEDKKGEQGEGEDGAPQRGAVTQMTPEQAIRLLEAFKADEKNLQFRPVLKTNRQDRVFKDW